DDCCSACSQAGQPGQERRPRWPHRLTEAQAPGSRKALNVRSIVRELETAALPRWDLIRTSDYRAMMLQTTVGCRFRCDFCDIIQSNGGFTRPKTLESVRAELGSQCACPRRSGG